MTYYRSNYIISPLSPCHFQQDAIFPSDSLEKLSSLLRFMIENCDEIFEVPREVATVAEHHCKRRKTTQVSCLDTPPSHMV